jgi:hypothetical protein
MKGNGRNGRGKMLDVYCGIQSMFTFHRVYGDSNYGRQSLLDSLLLRAHREPSDQNQVNATTARVRARTP